jgi:hypothetical protein
VWGRVNRCPKCNESKGEVKIRNYLEKNNVKFETQYKLPDCKNKNPLPFDFGILDKEGNLFFLIEYDGELHYKQKGFNNLERQKKHDEIKNKYCTDNNIGIFRITYKDYKNIDKTLKNIIEMEVTNG